MKKIVFLCIALSILFLACDNNSDDREINLTFTFNHFWETTPITLNDFNEIKFINKNGDVLSLERLRYVVSNLTITNENGVVSTFKDYNLVDVTNNSGLSFALSENITTGTYQNIAFTFGFKDDDNIDGAYQDLNIANFNVPTMLGGGYHYMQFDGKYLNSNNQEAPFNYHAIRAVDRSNPDNLQFEDTSFTVNLGEITITESAEIIVKVDISEWFKNPNTWNLNELNTVLMPNFNAQKLMNANGKSVFSLGKVIQ